MDFLVLLLLVLTVLNVWLSHRVLRAGPSLHHKGILVASVWLMPLLGPLMAVNHIRHYAPDPASKLFGSRLSRRPEKFRLKAPDEVPYSGLKPFPLRDHLTCHDGGTPKMDWSEVNRWLDPLVDDEQRDVARQACQRAWLLHVRDALGHDYRLLEYDRAFILAALDAADATGAFFTRVRGRIAEALYPLAMENARGGHSVLILVHDEEHWAAHLRGHGGDSIELSDHNSVFIPSGCPHFLARQRETEKIEPVIAHELTRQALSHLRLPVWIEAGIVINTEHMLTGGRLHGMSPHQTHYLHQRYWNEDTIQGFWSGEAFHSFEDASLLAHDLARILVEQLGKAWDAFALFAGQASLQDSGAQAAIRYLQIDLGQTVCALLEKPASPEWSPLSRQREPHDLHP